MDNTKYLLESDDPGVSPYLSNVVGCMLVKRCSCAGFSSGFSFIANYLGLEVIQNVGISKNPEMHKNPGHRWNMIKLSGNWYHVDATWIKNVQRFMYINFDDRIRYTEITPKYFLQPPKADFMDLNIIKLQDRFVDNEKQAAKYIQKCCDKAKSSFFVASRKLSIEMAPIISQQRFLTCKPLSFVSGTMQEVNIYLYLYEFKIELEDVKFIKGYPTENIDFNARYIVENDDTFKDKVQEAMKLGAKSVSYSKQQDFIEVKFIKEE